METGKLLLGSPKFGEHIPNNIGVPDIYDMEGVINDFYL